MGCSKKLISSSHNKLCNLIISFILLLIFSSTTQLTFRAEGRRHIKTRKALFLEPIDSAKTASVSEDKAILRALIGSRPPRCERRCSSCVHCEAIQVPANPQVKQPKSGSSSSRNSPTTTTVFTVAYSSRGGEYSSNYKPMSWKCKCGNFIFNP